MAPAAPIRVFIADDHPVYREGVARAVSEHAELELVGETADGDDALARIIELAPDVAVLDLQLPGMNGIAITAAVAEAEATAATRVLVLSAYTDPARVYDAIAAGAAGYLSKDSSRTAICDAIMRVARGEAILAPDAQTALREQIQSHDHAEPHLTPREHEILVLIAGGVSAPDIAKRTSLSTATVKGHLQSIYRKLEVNDRAAAAAAAVRLHLID